MEAELGWEVDEACWRHVEGVSRFGLKEFVGDRRAQN